MTDHDARNSAPMTGNADGAGYSSAGHEPVSSHQMSEPQGELTGHAGGAPYSAEGHGPASSTLRDAESIRQSEIAAREPLQHDPIGNALVAAPFTAARALGEVAYAGGAEVAGAIGKALFGVGKTAAVEGVEYMFKHMDDPSVHKPDAPDGGAGDASPGAGAGHDSTGSPEASGSHDPSVSQDPGMSHDPGMSQDPGMSHDDSGYFHH